MNIGHCIASLRLDHRMNQDDLALKLHVSRQTISNWENDRSYPDINSLIMLSDIFDVSLDDLVREDLPMMKNRIRKNNLRWLIFGIGLMMVLTYLSLFVLKYSVSLGSWLVGATTILGLILIYLFVKNSRSANLTTFKQVVAYISGKDVQPAEKISKGRVLGYVLAGIIGIGIGLLIVLLIFRSIGLISF